MEHGLTPIGPLGGTDGRVTPIQRASADRYTTPASPPAEVQADLDAAAQVIEQLSAQQVNLHFEVDHPSGTVHVQVLDSSGTVLREIPPRSLLDTLSGGGLLIDQRG